MARWLRDVRAPSGNEILAGKMTQRANHSNTADQNQENQENRQQGAAWTAGPPARKIDTCQEKPTSAAHAGKRQIKSTQRENWNRG
jgi:hypothetical protein